MEAGMLTWAYAWAYVRAGDLPRTGFIFPMIADVIVFLGIFGR